MPPRPPWDFSPFFIPGIGGDDLDARKRESGILGEPRLRSSNMIHSLKATAPTLSRGDGEETTCGGGGGGGGCFPVWLYLTASFSFFAAGSSLSLTPSHTKAYKYTMEAVTIPHRRKHQCARSLRQSVSEVKLFHLSGVLLSSSKASVRTAGRLIVTY